MFIAHQYYWSVAVEFSEGYNYARLKEAKKNGIFAQWAFHNL